MTSPTSIVESIRHRKKVRQGHRRKAALAAKGTTKSQKELFAKVDAPKKG